MRTKERMEEIYIPNQIADKSIGVNGNLSVILPQIHVAQIA